jgi:hypothetical protein
MMEKEFEDIPLQEITENSQERNSGNNLNKKGLVLL